MPDVTIALHLFPEQRTISLSLTHVVGVNADGLVIKKMACSGAILLEDVSQRNFEAFLTGFSAATINRIDEIEIPEA